MMERKKSNDKKYKPPPVRNDKVGKTNNKPYYTEMYHT